MNPCPHCGKDVADQTDACPHCDRAIADETSPPVAEVVEVVPNLKLEQIDRAPDYIAGLFNYRGQHVPVVDLCRLLQGRSCSRLFTTRIVLVNFRSADGNTRLLGLLGERITDTMELDDDALSDTGLGMADTPYLGKAAHSEHGLIQHMNIRELLPIELQAQLFAAEV